MGLETDFGEYVSFKKGQKRSKRDFVLVSQKFTIQKIRRAKMCVRFKNSTQVDVVQKVEN